MDQSIDVKDWLVGNDGLIRYIVLRDQSAVICSPFIEGTITWLKSKGAVRLLVCYF